MVFNKYQSTEETLKLESLPDEVQEEFKDLMDVPFIKYMVSPERKRAKDLPRDEKGRIIVDIIHPHILEDMDYFRPSAIHFQKTGRYTDLKPNSNKNSAYGKWMLEEVRRCKEGYVRESDGEWIPGNMYFFLNYCVIPQTKTEKGTKKAKRIIDFPEVWDGIYLRFHYIEQAQYGGLYDELGGNNGCEISSRGKSKSLTMASILARYFVLGERHSETADNKEKESVKVMAMAYSSEYLINDGILNKFQGYMDFIAENTEFPHLMLQNSIKEMAFTMGWKDVEGVRHGTLNECMGLALKDDVGKGRGKRMNFIVGEEFGTFKNIREIYNIMLPSVQEGGYSFGTMYLIGTSGEKESDFQQATEIVYNPEGYNMYGLPNAFDKPGEGRKHITFFYPEYLNRKGHYDINGNSDVTGALIDILMIRYQIKYNSTDIKTVTRNIAERPITPQEAMLRSRGNMFPTNDLLTRLNEIDNDSRIFDKVYVGNLAFKGEEVEFVVTNEEPIRIFPTEDNKVAGAIEFYELPDKSVKIPTNRYIMGVDPVDSDEAQTMSLFSTFVLDLWTDRIVAEYTGRQQYADDNFEIARKLAIFYNATILYEAHPYDQIVRFPDGTMGKWGDVKIGDELISPEGKSVKIKDIPIDGIDDIYKITLNDGREVEASKNHLWKVYEYSKNKKLQIVTTERMFNQGTKTKHGASRYFIPDCSPVEYTKKEVPIDPYALGLLISEGALTKFKLDKHKIHKRSSVQFSASKDDAEFYKTVLPYSIKYIGNKGYSWHMYIDDIDIHLDNLGLLGKNSQQKFIPRLYLFNDYNTRLELLKGIMDGDGCATERGGSVLITTSKQLLEDVKLLCRSLGIKCKENKGQEAHYGKITTDKEYYIKQSYRLCISADIPIFKLPRKANKQHIYTPGIGGSKASGFLHRTAIANIEYVGKKPCKCVTVDSEDGLYLIGDYIVTHNCNIKGMFSYFSKMSCLHLLADTPQYLVDKQMVRFGTIGNQNKGVRATKAINNYADELTKEWLIQPEVYTGKDEDGNDVEVTKRHLFSLKNRAFIQELIQYKPVGNYDRIRAFGMLMLYREEFMIKYGGEISREEEVDENAKSKDTFFTRNFVLD